MGKYRLLGRPLRIGITVACEMAFILFGVRSLLSLLLFLAPFPTIVADPNAAKQYDQGVFSGIVGNADFFHWMKHPNDSLEGIIVSMFAPLPPLTPLHTHTYMHGTANAS